MNESHPTSRASFRLRKIERTRENANQNDRLATRPVSAGRITVTAKTLAKLQTVGLSYAALRKECLDAVRQWPGCETIGAIRIIREKMPGDFSIRITLYGRTNKKLAN